MRARSFSVLVLCGGCYTYTPVEPGAVTPGASVRARISASASDRLAPLLGPSGGRLLSGSWISATSDTFVVEVPSVNDAQSGGTIQTLHQRVSIARGELLELEARTLDRVRTGALAAAAAVVVGGVVIKALKGEPGMEKFPGGGGPGEVRIPLERQP